MTLIQLLDATIAKAQIPTSRHKDLKTSIRYLAKALGRETPEQCQDDEFLVPEVTWKQRLNVYMGSLTPIPSAHTIRNTRNNLSYLFRQAQAREIMPSITRLPRLLSRRAADTMLGQTSPYRTRYIQRGYYLAFADWPPSLQDGLVRYYQQRILQIREVTYKRVRSCLEYYIGYLVRVEHMKIAKWDDLFNCDYLNSFIHWHSGQKNIRITALSYKVSEVLSTIASYEKHSSAQIIREYIRQLPQPEPMHDKRYHWFTLRELDDVAISILNEAHLPVTSTRGAVHPGLSRSLRHATSLMLRILVRIPLRQRNLREMQRGRNLYQDQGHWHLTFRGEELKIARKHGRINRLTFDLSKDFSDLISHLEEYLYTYRPRIPNADKSEIVFLTQRGTSHTPEKLWAQLRAAVFQHTNKRFYPHLIRTIWVTEMLERGLNIDTIAYMLNDDPITILKRYHELFGETHAHKAGQILQTLFSTDGVTTTNERKIPSMP